MNQIKRIFYTTIISLTSIFSLSACNYLSEFEKNSITQNNSNISQSQLNIDENLPIANKPIVNSISNSQASPTIPQIVKEKAENIPILMYHSIADQPGNDLMVSPQNFAAQIAYLKKAGYQTINFQDLQDWQAGKPIPRKPILLTFDDGYLDNYTEAYPVLKEHGFQATFFISTNYIADGRHITWEQIAEMSKSGLIEFASHTKSHADLAVISPEQLTAELTESKQIIETKIGKPVIAFSYPAGSYNNAVVDATAKAGYQFAVTTKPGKANIDQGVLTLHRVRVHGYYTADDFAEIFP